MSSFLRTHLDWIGEILGIPMQIVDSYVNYYTQCHNSGDYGIIGTSIQTPVSVNSMPSSVRREGSNTEQGSYQELFTGNSDMPYGINTDQDVGIVYKAANSADITVSRYSYESRHAMFEPKLKEIAISALYAFYFENKDKPELRGVEFNRFLWASEFLVVSINDVNINRPNNYVLHVDGFVGHTFLKPEMNELLKTLLRAMNNNSETPQIVTIGFKTTTQAQNPRVILTTIKDGQTYTFTTAPAAVGNMMPQIIFRNTAVIHGTPRPINEVMYRQIQSQFHYGVYRDPSLSQNQNPPNNGILPPDVQTYITNYNNYIELSQTHTRHFVRRAMNICSPNPALVAQMERLKQYMRHTAAIVVNINTDPQAVPQFIITNNYRFPDQCLNSYMFTDITHERLILHKELITPIANIHQRIADAQTEADTAEYNKLICNGNFNAYHNPRDLAVYTEKQFSIAELMSDVEDMIRSESSEGIQTFACATAAAASRGGSNLKKNKKPKKNKKQIKTKNKIKKQKTRNMKKRKTLKRFKINK